MKWQIATNIANGNVLKHFQTNRSTRTHQKTGNKKEIGYVKKGFLITKMMMAVHLQVDFMRASSFRTGTCPGCRSRDDLVLLLLKFFQPDHTSASSALAEPQHHNIKHKAR